MCESRFPWGLALLLGVVLGGLGVAVPGYFWHASRVEKEREEAADEARSEFRSRKKRENVSIFDREEAARAKSANNLKQISDAVKNHHEQNDALPPAGKELPRLKPDILPFIEQEDLIKQVDKAIKREIDPPARPDK